MKIYTRTGDDGQTGLFAGGRVGKDDHRVDAYGEVDELNSAIGVVVAWLEPAGAGELVAKLRLVQRDLFTIGATLATPEPEDPAPRNPHVPRIADQRIELLERWIDEADAEIEPLQHFILPGGSKAGAQLHLARTVCRRAERRVVALARGVKLDHHVIIYLNRLSDLLFTYARLANHRAGVEEVEWVPNPR
jgi:cob(I)alamin adenosyltransferase